MLLHHWLDKFFWERNELGQVPLLDNITDLRCTHLFCILHLEDLVIEVSEQRQAWKLHTDFFRALFIIQMIIVPNAEELPVDARLDILIVKSTF